MIGHNSRAKVHYSVIEDILGFGRQQSIFEVRCAHYNVIVTSFEGKLVFRVAKKFVVFIQKAVEQKRNTFEIRFLYKKCQS